VEVLECREDSLEPSCQRDESSTGGGLDDEPAQRTFGPMPGTASGVQLQEKPVPRREEHRMHHPRAAKTLEPIPRQVCSSTYVWEDVTLTLEEPRRAGSEHRAESRS